MNYSERFFRQSDYWYNDGLSKANIHDLSGAIASLKRSLQYNRSNIQARNLLGLVYYGQGEVAEALVEWIISKNLKSYENIANYYIKKVQESSGELDRMNQAIHKYNQCLLYAKQNGEDLAIIQLKKVIQIHPSFLKAYQLLALMYMHTEQYAQARQILRKAYKMDITNSITLTYMNELSKMRSKKVSHIKKEKKEETLTYSMGNETIIQPVSSGLKENTGLFTVMNIVIGIIVGAAVVWFLILPTAVQNKTKSTNDTIVSLSEEVAARDTQISVLKQELDGYRSTSDEAENAIQTSKGTQQNYEALLNVKALYDGGQTSNADMLDILLQIDANSLETYGKTIYDEISGDLFPKMCTRLYASGSEKLNAGDYEGAIADLEKVVRMDEKYENGNAASLLEEARQKKGTEESGTSESETSESETTE